MSKDLARWIFEYGRTCRVCSKNPVARRIPGDVPGVTLRIQVPDEPLCAVCVAWASRIIWLEKWIRKQREKDEHGGKNPVRALQHEREPGIDQQRTRLVGELGRRLAASPRLQSV